MSLEYWKREKNFRALDKGYVRDPEGFGFWFLFKRLREEVDELRVALINNTGYSDMRIDNFSLYHQAQEVIVECADVSNLVDYIASKAAEKYPDKYIPDEEVEASG